MPDSFLASNTLPAPIDRQRPCLGEDTVLDFVGGRLGAAAIADVEAHLDACADCQLLFSCVGSATSRAPRACHLPRPGELLGGRFRLERCLGMGASGVVFAARDEELDAPVAVKLLRSHAGDAAEHLRREIVLGRRIGHPNVCRVHDLGTSDERRFITMELVAGSTLADVMRARVEPARAAAILDAICAALAAAHAEGVIHRDLKPSNILVEPGGRVVVTDFGLARDARAERESRALVGTPAYWAPELLRGAPATSATDLYAVGIIAFELLSGQSAARLAQPGAFDLVPRAYRRTLRRCLSVEVGLRPRSAEALRRALGWATPQRRRAAAGLAAALACVLGLVAHEGPGRHAPAPLVAAMARPMSARQPARPKDVRQATITAVAEVMRTLPER
jgi:hypothetical protein